MTITPTSPSTKTGSLAGFSDVGASEAPGLKLTCQQPDLARGLSLVSRAVLSHSPLPILTNILMATDRGRLCLSATNLEIGIQTWVDAHIEQEGSTALPADLLTRIVNLMPHEKMSLSVAAGSQTLTLQCAGSVSNLRGQDPREFPLIPGIQGVQPTMPWVLEAGLLKKMIEQVAFAAETNDSKPVLTAVFVQMGAGQLTFAAANTFRLAERMEPLPGAEEAQQPLLVPARNLMELARVLPAQGAVQIAVTPQHNQVVFQCDQGERLTFVSRLIEGTYPAYHRSIPKEFTTRAVVETRPLARAVERAALFARDEWKTARLTFRGGSPFGTLTVEADDADMGNHISTVSAEVTGPELQIIFPVRTLCEALERLETPQVVFSVLDPGKPGVLKPMADIHQLYLLMSAHEKTVTRV